MMNNNITEKADQVATEVQSNVHNLPITSLFLVGLAGVGIMSVVNCVGKLFDRNCHSSRYK